MKEVKPELPDVQYSGVVIDGGFVDEEVHFLDYAKHPERRAEMKKQEDAVRTVLQHTAGSATLKGLEAIGDSIATWRRYTGLAKIPSFVKLLDNEFNSGVDKIVVFAMHRSVIMELRQQLRGYNPLILWGGTPALKKKKIINKFEKQAKYHVFIGQIVAAGVGIDLSVAHDVFFLESSFVPGENAQAAMRCHNLYQKDPVSVRFVSLKNSVDRRVQDALRRKTKDINQLLT